jgi:hypothetical protein
MAKDWSDLEAKLKNIEAKKSEGSVDKDVGEALFPEKPKKQQPERGEFTKYMERVQRAYVQSARQGSVAGDKFSSMTDELNKPKLTDDSDDILKQHFKGMEKRFLKPR